MRRKKIRVKIRRSVRRIMVKEKKGKEKSGEEI